MTSVWIIGGGKFGRRAAHTLHACHPRISISLIDRDESVCRNVRRDCDHVVCMDGIDFLESNLQRSATVDYVVPAIPSHVAGEWVKRMLCKKHRIEPIEVPQEIIQQLPNVMKGRAGEICVSNADFICPENCPEPAEICTITQRSRPRIMHEYLAALRYKDYRAVVLQSEQLAPGVGGYAPVKMFEALDRIENSETPVLFSTACKCHGVLQAFTISA
jgi:hypothetical protein